MKLNKKDIIKQKIGDVCHLQQGLQVNKSERLSEKKENSHIYITVDFLKRQETYEYIDNPRSSVMCNEEDILVSRTGTVGNIVSGVNGVFHNNFFKLILNNNCHQKFIYYFLKNKKIKKEMIKRANGAVIPDLKHSEFLSIEFPVLDLINQIKSANYIEKMDENLNCIKKLLKKIEIRNQYYADELLDGKSYIENNKIFKNIKFTKPILIDTIINDLPKSKLDAAVGSDKGEYRFFKSSAETYWSDDFIYDVEAIVMADGGKANVEYYNGKFSTSNHVYVFNSPLLNNKYFYYLLKSKIHLIDNCFQGAALKNLSKKQFKQLELNIFEEVEYQNRIVFFLDNLNNEKEKIEKLLHLEKQRFEWLSDKLLSGEYIIED